MKKNYVIYFSLIIVLFLGIFSLLYFFDNGNNSDLNTDNEIQENTVVNKNLEEETEIITPKINWDEEIKFSECNYGKNLDFSTDENYGKIRDIIMNIQPYSQIYEVCKNSDNSKYILSFENRFGLTIGRYDSDLDIFEEVSDENCLFERCGINGYSRLSKRNYGDISLEKYLVDYKNIEEKKDGFGVRNGDEILFKDFGHELIGMAESAPSRFTGIFQFFDLDDVDYCNTGLNSDGTLSVCFADIEYKYNYIKNTIQESRLCSYYINTNGEIKTLEKCFNFPGLDGYELVGKQKGFDYFEKNGEETSIFVIDLESNNFDFGILKAFTGSIYEGENEEFSRFERLGANGGDEGFPQYGIMGKDFSHVIGKNYFFVNGGFFNAGKDPTALSFPLKIDGKIVNSHVDNDLEKRTLILKNGKLEVLDGYDEKYLNDDSIESLAVAFDPVETDLMKDSKLGRTFFGIDIDGKIIFVVSNSSTQQNMIDIMNDFGVKEKNIIMFDGGPSAGFGYYRSLGPGTDYQINYFNWKVPHLFGISHK